MEVKGQTERASSLLPHVGFGDQTQTQVVKLGGKCPYPLNHLTGLQLTEIILNLISQMRLLSFSVYLTDQPSTADYKFYIMCKSGKYQ